MQSKWNQPLAHPFFHPSVWPSFNNAVFFMTFSFHFCVTRLLLLKLPGRPVALASLKRGDIWLKQTWIFSGQLSDTLSAHLNEAQWGCGSWMVVDVKSYKYQSQKQHQRSCYTGYHFSVSQPVALGWRICLHICFEDNYILLLYWRHLFIKRNRNGLYKY